MKHLLALVGACVGVGCLIGFDSPGVAVTVSVTVGFLLGLEAGWHWRALCITVVGGLRIGAWEILHGLRRR